MSYFSILTPAPGSKAWRMLMQDPIMREKHAGYRLDPTILQSDFIERFTDLGQDGLTYLNRRLDQIFRTDPFTQRDY